MRLRLRCFILSCLFVLSTSLFSMAAESTWTVSCGNNQGSASYRIAEPTHTPTTQKRFAIIMNGSPAVGYFGDNGKSYKKLVQSLNGAGYRTLEVKYANQPVECGTAGKVGGFFSLCCGQGLPATIAHDEQIYDLAIEQLGYQPNNLDHQLLGFGLSLGALQVQTMAFISGRKFTRVGLTGILVGNSKEGCETSHSKPPIRNGMAWTGFETLADMITLNTHGCSQKEDAPLEFTEDYNFDHFLYRYQADLGLFEGNSALLGGHPKQAEFIFNSRGISPTTLKTYSACGHDPWICISGARHLNADILQWATAY